MPPHPGTPWKTPIPKGRCSPPPMGRRGEPERRSGRLPMAMQQKLGSREVLPVRTGTRWPTMRRWGAPHPMTAEVRARFPGRRTEDSARPVVHSSISPSRHPSQHRSRPGPGGPGLASRVGRGRESERWEAGPRRAARHAGRGSPPDARDPGRGPRDRLRRRPPRRRFRCEPARRPVQHHRVSPESKPPASWTSPFAWRRERDRASEDPCPPSRGDRLSR